MCYLGGLGGEREGGRGGKLLNRGSRGIVRNLEGFVGVDVIGVPWLRGVEVRRRDGTRADVEYGCWEEGEPGWHSSYCYALGVFLSAL